MTTASSPNPVRFEGDLDPQLSRWLWLVKWLLVIPHVIVLVFLWIAFLVLWLVAFRRVTGRYPLLLLLRARNRSLPTPFTLADVADYPARLNVDHPQELSRGLVLVKWWLLALPHYLIVGVFAAARGPASTRPTTTGHGPPAAA